MICIENRSWMHSEANLFPTAQKIVQNRVQMTHKKMRKLKELEYISKDVTIRIENRS